MIFVLIAMATSFLVTLFVLRRTIRGEAVSAGDGEARRNVWSRNSHLKGWGRTGGLAVVAGLGISMAVRMADNATVAGMGLLLLLSALPVVIAGLADDVTQRVAPWIRLCAAFVSAALAGVLLGAWVGRVDVSWAEALVVVPAISVFLSCCFVAGLTNAFNIIDGFNGLASGVANLLLLAIAYVAFKVGDIFVLTAALTAVGATAGFMLLNFPRGLVILGDGGAYFLGFWIGELLILLVARNPGVSAWFPVLLCSYPVCELLFSIYRRAFVRRSHPWTPDVAHLHHLIYKRWVGWVAGRGSSAQYMMRNAMTTPYLWVFTSFGAAPAAVFWQHTHVLQLGSAVLALGYLYAYRRIVRFRSPRWVVLRHSRWAGKSRDGKG